MEQKTNRPVTDKEWELICTARNIRKIQPDSRKKFEADAIDQLFSLFEQED